MGLRGAAVSAPVCDPVTVRAGRQPRACHRVHSVSSSPLPGRSAGFSPAEATTPPRSGRVEALLPWAPGRVGSAWTRGPGCGSDTGVLGAALTWVSWCGLDVGVMAPAQTQASWVLWVRLGRGRRGCRCLLSDLLERLTCHVFGFSLADSFPPQVKRAPWAKAPDAQGGAPGPGLVPASQWAAGDPFWAPPRAVPPFFPRVCVSPHRPLLLAIARPLPRRLADPSEKSAASRMPGGANIHFYASQRNGLVSSVSGRSDRK